MDFLADSSYLLNVSMLIHLRWGYLHLILKRLKSQVMERRLESFQDEPAQLRFAVPLQLQYE